MGYALFAQRKLVLDAQLNAAELQQVVKSNAQYELATQKLGLDQELSSLKVGQAQELSTKYAELAAATTEDERSKIQAEINQMEQAQQGEIDGVNQKIYVTAVKEQAIELEVKRLDTMVTALQKQLDAVEQAEGQAIDRATPKFKGLG